MKKKINLLIGTILLMVMMMNTEVKAEDSLNISRISGMDRYETSINISKEAFSKSKYAVIASGEGFSDALVGGSLSAQVDAPMLLVSKDNMKKEVQEELLRLKVEDVFLLGGENTISKKVEEDIKSLGIKVERLSGKNRVETAKSIGDKKIELKGNTEYITIYAGIDGDSFADSLSAGAFVGEWSKRLGVVNLIPNMNKDKQDMEYIHVFGGENSVPAGKEKIRFQGSSRYETSVDVAEGYYNCLQMEVETVILVSGEDYPDALAASGVAGIKDAPVILTERDKLPKLVEEYIKRKNIRNIIIVGGENSVSSNIENNLNNL